MKSKLIINGNNIQGCNEILNINAPRIMKEVHIDYLNAGANIIKTNSFGAIPSVLSEYDISEMAYEISKKSAIISKEAIKDFNKAIKINPNYSEAYNNKGIYNAKLNMYKEAIKNYNKAIKLNQNLSEAYNNRGISKAKLNMYEEAIKDYNKAIELNKDNPFYYYNRGNSKYNLSNLVKKEENKINEYSQLVKEAYEDFEIAYSLSNSKLKKYLINKIIVLAKENNETAIKFCEEHNIDYKNYKEEPAEKSREYTWLDEKYYYLPNVIGMNLSDAKKTLKNFKIEYAGEGTNIIAQEPNSIWVKEGSIVKLLLDD